LGRPVKVSKLAAGAVGPAPADASGHGVELPFEQSQFIRRIHVHHGVLAAADIPDAAIRRLDRMQDV